MQYLRLSSWYNSTIFCNMYCFVSFLNLYNNNKTIWLFTKMWTNLLFSSTLTFMSIFKIITISYNFSKYTINSCIEFINAIFWFTITRDLSFSSFLIYTIEISIFFLISFSSMKIVILLKSFVKLSWMKIIFFFFDFFWMRIFIENHQKNWIKTRRCFNFDKNCLHIVSYFIFNFRNEFKNVYRLFVASILKSIIVIFCLIFKISSYARYCYEFNHALNNSSLKKFMSCSNVKNVEHKSVKT